MNAQQITTETRIFNNGISVIITTDTTDNEYQTTKIEAFHDLINDGFGLEGDIAMIHHEDHENDDDLQRAIEREVKHVVSVVQSWLDFEDEPEPDGAGGGDNETPTNGIIVTNTAPSTSFTPIDFDSDFPYENQLQIVRQVEEFNQDGAWREGEECIAIEINFNGVWVTLRDEDGSEREEKFMNPVDEDEDEEGGEPDGVGGGDKEPTLINTTPHELTLTREDGSILTLPPSGRVWRVGQTTSLSGTIHGVPVHGSVFGEVIECDPDREQSNPTAIPDPSPDVFYVVSSMVKSALNNRPDLLATHIISRDSGGKPTAWQLSV